MAIKLRESVSQYVEREYLRFLLWFADPNYHQEGLANDGEDIQELKLFFIDSIHSKFVLFFIVILNHEIKLATELVI